MICTICVVLASCTQLPQHILLCSLTLVISVFLLPRVYKSTWPVKLCFIQHVYKIPHVFYVTHVSYCMCFPTACDLFHTLVLCVLFLPTDFYSFLLLTMFYIAHFWNCSCFICYPFYCQLTFICIFVFLSTIDVYSLCFISACFVLTTFCTSQMVHEVHFVGFFQSPCFVLTTFSINIFFCTARVSEYDLRYIEPQSMSEFGTVTGGESRSI